MVKKLLLLMVFVGVIIISAWAWMSGLDALMEGGAPAGAEEKSPSRTWGVK
jgi:hypothetical protein